MATGLIESKPSQEANPATPKENWIQFLVQQGPIGALVAGGAVALSSGLFPVFEIRQATFGASLLLIAALIEVFIWNTRQRIAERQVQRAQRYRQDADKAFQASEKHLSDTAAEEPGKPKVPSLPTR